MPNRKSNPTPKAQETAPAEKITPTPERQRPKRVFFKPEGEPLGITIAGFEIIRYWVKYPFQVGFFFVDLPKPSVPRWQTTRPPTPAMLKLVKDALKVPLNVLQVRKKVLEFFPTADIENWSFLDLMQFCDALIQDIENDGVKKDASAPAAVAAPVDKTDKPPLGKIAGWIYEKLKSLPEHKAMTLPEIADWLAQDKGKICDETTLCTKHLPQLKPYGLMHKKRIGYYLR